MTRRQEELQGSLYLGVRDGRDATLTPIAISSLSINRTVTYSFETLIERFNQLGYLVTTTTADLVFIF